MSFQAYQVTAEHMSHLPPEVRLAVKELAREELVAIIKQQTQDWGEDEKMELDFFLSSDDYLFDICQKVKEKHDKRGG